MKFGAVPVAEASGAILAHTTRAGSLTLRKGHRLTRSDTDQLAKAGISSVVVARLDAGDVHEDDAAARLAQALAGAHVRLERAFTGRANLFADAAGVVDLDEDTINRINRIDPAITVATLDAFAPVETGRMVATVKIIPFAVPRAVLDRALAMLAGPAIRVSPYRLKRIGLVATTLPQTKTSVLDKTRSVLEDRLAPAGAAVVEERRVPHDEEAVRAAVTDIAKISDAVVVFGASAIVDAADIVPAGILAAGGTIDHFGMPVDPGNLLLLAHLGDTPVLGAPGCARSPKENGFDWILARLLAGLSVEPDHVMGLGVGGLLMEIVTRPQPRRGPEPAVPATLKIAGVVLAAGRSSRMGAENKLLMPYRGRPLVAHAVGTAGAAGLDPVILVTGHEAGAVASAVGDAKVTTVHNPDFAAGLSTSLRTGIAAIPEDVDAAFVLLADMPMVEPALLNTMADHLNPEAGQYVVVPRHGEVWGNPVLFHRRFFRALQGLTGDRGARAFLNDTQEAITFVEAGNTSVTLDIDTPAQYESLEK